MTESMQAKSEAQLLRIFIGESDKIRHVPLYEVLMREAKAAGLAGARPICRLCDGAWSKASRLALQVSAVAVQSLREP